MSFFIKKLNTFYLNINRKIKLIFCNTKVLLTVFKEFTFFPKKKIIPIFNYNLLNKNHNDFQSMKKKFFSGNIDFYSSIYNYISHYKKNSQIRRKYSSLEKKIYFLD